MELYVDEPLAQDLFTSLSLPLPFIVPFVIKFSSVPEPPIPTIPVRHESIEGDFRLVFESAPSPKNIIQIPKLNHGDYSKARQYYSSISIEFVSPDAIAVHHSLSI